MISAGSDIGVLVGGFVLRLLVLLAALPVTMTVDWTLEPPAGRGARPRPDRGERERFPSGSRPLRGRGARGGPLPLERRPPRAAALPSPGRRPHPRAAALFAFHLGEDAPLRGPVGRFGDVALSVRVSLGGEVLRPARRARTLWGRSAKSPTVGRMKLRSTRDGPEGASKLPLRGIRTHSATSPKCPEVSQPLLVEEARGRRPLRRE